MCMKYYQIVRKNVRKRNAKEALEPFYQYFTNQKGGYEKRKSVGFLDRSEYFLDKYKVL